jgi:PAS domain S-box-containing protein
MSSDKFGLIRVLHVDDDPAFLEISKEILMTEGSFEVDDAVCVDEAFEKIEADNYDVVVSDYQMPQKDGLQFLTELHEKKKIIPFILFTGQGREEIAIKALNLGANYYLNKHGSTETVYGELSHSIKLLCERKKVEEQLKNSEEQFRQLFTNMPSGVAVYNPVDNGKDFIFKDFNESAERIEKTPKEDVIGKRVTEAFPNIKEDGLLEVFQRVWQTGNPECIPATLYQDRQNQDSWRESCIYKLPSGEIVAISKDISESKKAEDELKKSHAKLKVMNEKLQVIGSLTRHDIANKLMVIETNAYVLKNKIGNNPELIKHLERIDSTMDQISKLFEFSRVYEKIGSEQLTKINVEKCFNEATFLFSKLQNIQVLNQCQGLTVPADSLLRQLFYNLIDNSLKHGKKVTQIKISYKENKDNTTLLYEDDGVGLSANEKIKLLGTDFTGKEVGRGLPLLKKIAEVYGWTITEQGKEGKGAKFAITIPTTN